MDRSKNNKRLELFSINPQLAMFEQSLHLESLVTELIRETKDARTVKVEGSFLKGHDGKTPIKGHDYFTAEDIRGFLELAAPKKGVDYMTDADMASIISSCSPKKGIDYLTEAEMAEIRKAAKPVAGIDFPIPQDGAPGIDGKSPSVKDIAKEVMRMMGSVPAKKGRTEIAIPAAVIQQDPMDVVSWINGQERIIDWKAIKNVPYDVLHSSPGKKGKKFDHGGGISTILAGTNITVTPDPLDGGRVTISSSGGSGASAFTDLSDVPGSYAGSSLKVVRVNVGETGLEFATLAGGGNAQTADPLSQFAATTSLQLKGVMTDETGSGALVFADTPTLVTPILGAATATSINGATITSGTLNGSVTGTNTGDQTSIVGITGTKAQFDTAVTDGNFLYVGDVTQYTDELAQDAVGAMVDATLVYTDLTPLLSRAALTGAITASAGSNATSLGSFTKAALDAAVSDGNVMYDGDSITNATGTAWRVFYSDGTGVITELALGADGTFLKSNGAAAAPSFATPAGSGDVSKVGTPVNNQIGVWTGDGTIEGDVDLTFDTATNTLSVAPIGLDGIVQVHSVKSDASDGLLIEAANGTDVGLLGVGNTANATWNGSHNFEGGQVAVGKSATTLGKLKLYGSTSGDVTIQPNAVAGTGIVLTAPATTGTIALTSDLASAKKVTIGFSATSPVTGQQGSYVVFPVAGTITGYKIVSDTGTATVKTWKIASGTAAPTIANVISTSGVSLSSGTAIISSTTSDFTTTAVAANDIFAFDLTAVSGSTKLLFELEISIT